MNRFPRRLLSSLRSSSSNQHDFPPIEKMMLPDQLKARVHAKESMRFWQKVNWVFTLPVLVLVAIYTLPQEYKHIQHLKEHGPDAFVPLPYMRKRKSTYAWGDGDHTIFYNEQANADPDAE